MMRTYKFRTNLSRVLSKIIWGKKVNPTTFKLPESKAKVIAEFMGWTYAYRTGTNRVVYSRPDVREGYCEFIPKDQWFNVERHLLKAGLHKYYVNYLVKIAQNKEGFACKEHIAMSATIEERMDAAIFIIKKWERVLL